MRVFVYLFAPMETWLGWISEDEFHRQLHDRASDAMSGEGWWVRYRDLRDSGYRAAERLGWFGDILGGPYVAGLPLPSARREANVMVAWRGGIEGQTFLTSPIELPWLREEPRSAWTCAE